MLGEILQAILQETKALFSGTGAQVMLKTNFLPKATPDNNGTFVLLDLQNAPDTTQFPGGLTMCCYDFGVNTYTWEPDSYVDDDTPFSTSLLNFIDKVRQHFTLGPLGNGLVYPNGILIVNKIYQVVNSTIIYNGNPLITGTYFTCLDGITSFTSASNGYVIGTSWLTQGMVDIFNQFGFQFTLTGITNADALDQNGIIMGYKIGLISTSFDQITQFNEDDVVLTTISELLGDEVQIDESFENVLFPTIYINNTTQLSAQLNVDFNILRPNFSIDLSQDSFINVNNVPEGPIGIINVNLETGNENIHLNGNEVFTKPTIPGVFQIHYQNINGTLNFS